MKADAEVYLTSFFAEDQKYTSKQAEELNLGLQRMYSGLLDNSPVVFSSFLTPKELLAYAQEMYVHRLSEIPDKTTNNVHLAQQFILEGSSEIESILFGEDKSGEERSHFDILNSTYDSHSLAERLDYGFSHENVDRMITAHLRHPITQYIPADESWRRESDVGERYEIFPSNAHPVGNSVIAPALGYANAMAPLIQTLLNTPNISLKNMRQKIKEHAKSAQSKLLDENEEEHPTKRTSFKKKTSDKEYEKYYADIQKELEEQQIGELEKEFEDFDPQYHAIAFNKKKENNNN